MLNTSCRPEGNDLTRSVGACDQGCHFCYCVSLHFVDRCRAVYHFDNPMTSKTFEYKGRSSNVAGNAPCFPGLGLLLPRCGRLVRNPRVLSQPVFRAISTMFKGTGTGCSRHSRQPIAAMLQPPKSGCDDEYTDSLENRKPVTHT